jgi:hypothetical protein
MLLKICFSIIKVTEEDYTLLHLLIVALLFSKGLSMIEDEPLLNDPLAVHQAQSHYTRLIWNYLLDKQGEQKMIRQFTQLLSLVFRIQSKTKYVQDYSRVLFNLPNVADFFYTTPATYIPYCLILSSVHEFVELFDGNFLNLQTI